MDTLTLEQRKATLDALIAKNGGKYDASVKEQFEMLCPTAQVTTRTKQAQVESNKIFLPLAEVQAELNALLDSTNNPNWKDKAGNVVKYELGKAYLSKKGKNADSVITPISAGFGNSPMILAVDGKLELVSMADYLQGAISRLEQHAAILTAVQGWTESKLAESTK